MVVDQWEIVISENRESTIFIYTIRQENPQIFSLWVVHLIIYN